ncbi:MAG: ATP-grasp domain-containing protein [Bacteroidales bacterium]|nr:ATP-grasp domain-containing protein [Bacteroidales bacterium]
MMQKRLMLLGGIRYLLPVIKAAHEQGYYVITADYLPDNIAHKYSDEYVNVSIIDKEAVLKVAQKKQIDGIMSFGVDPGVVSASYVQEKLGLPSFGPYESVCILQNKDLFRAFLKEHGFNVPKAKDYASLKETMADRDSFDYPVIVKPTDSAGSKGVSRVDKPEQLEAAVSCAFNKSLSGHIIIEDFIEKQGCSSDTDSFSVDGKLKFVSFNAQYFDVNAANPYAPAAYAWPSTFTMEQEEYLTSEIQRLITLLGMKTSIYNIETRIGVNGKPYIMEFTPRGGGNRLCEMLHYATGVDLITAMTRYIVGDSVPEVEQKYYDGHWAEVILHADREGAFDHLEISKDLLATVVEEDLWIKKGDCVNCFEGANDAIGTLVLRFVTAKEMIKAIEGVSSWLHVVVK